MPTPVGLLIAMTLGIGAAPASACLCAYLALDVVLDVSRRPEVTVVLQNKGDVGLCHFLQDSRAFTAYRDGRPIPYPSGAPHMSYRPPDCPAIPVGGETSVTLDLGGIYDLQPGDRLCVTLQARADAPGAEEQTFTRCETIR